MSWTKRQLVDEAYAELALAGHTFDLTPEEKQTALRRMDAMVALWEARGITLGYPLHSDPTLSDLDEDSGLPDRAIEPVFMNLAVRLSPGQGKQLPAATLNAARDGYSLLLIAAAMPDEQLRPGGFPLGAGNRTWYGGGDAFTSDPSRDALDDVLE